MLSRYQRPTAIAAMAIGSATRMSTACGTPYSAWLPRVKSRAPTRMVWTMISTPSVAIAAAAPPNRAIARPMAKANRLTRAVVTTRLAAKPISTVANAAGRSGSTEALSAGLIVSSAEIWAATPMNATWPKLTTPELPVKTPIATTATSAISAFVTVPWGARPRNT